MVDGPAEDRPPAAILLLSDGETTTRPTHPGRPRGSPPRRADPHRGARDPQRDNQGAGRHAAARSPRPETMRRIAELSGGRAFEVDNAGELAGLYEDLGSRVATDTEEREITAAFAAGGLVLLLLAAALGVRATARLP